MVISLSGIPIFVNIQKYNKIKKMANVIAKQGKKITKKNKIKNTKIKGKCVGGGGAIFSICSNTIPQLEQFSLQPSTDLHHRHLLQTTSYNHLLLLHLLISRKGKLKQQQARNPPRGVEKLEGPSALQPTTESVIIR